eukprot:5808555-Prymnesium_polylepis.1
MSNVFVITSYTPTALAEEGVKTTRSPTAAAPKYLLSTSMPVWTGVSNVPMITSYVPTESALRGAKTTRFPTAAAPENLSPMERMPVEHDESK